MPIGSWMGRSAPGRSGDCSRRKTMMSCCASPGATGKGAFREGKLRTSTARSITFERSPECATSKFPGLHHCRAKVLLLMSRVHSESGRAQYRVLRAWLLCAAICLWFAPTLVQADDNPITDFFNQLFGAGGKDEDHPLDFVDRHAPLAPTDLVRSLKQTEKL